ncbi:hypothetical protein Trydic_g12628 [Trypoxylus dichotomus]
MMHLIVYHHLRTIIKVNVGTARRQTRNNIRHQYSSNGYIEGHCRIRRGDGADEAPRCRQEHGMAESTIIKPYGNCPNTIMTINVEDHESATEERKNGLLLNDSLGLSFLSVTPLDDGS